MVLCSKINFVCLCYYFVLQNTGFEDDNDDDWDISSLEDVPAGHKSTVRKSMDKSIDTSTSVWGTFTELGQEPGMESL